MWLCTEWDRHWRRRVHLNEHWHNYQWKGSSLFYLEDILFCPPRNQSECVLCWFCSSYTGRSLSRFDPNFEFLSWKHGSGCGYKMQHPKLPEANKKESLWYVWYFWTLTFLAFFYFQLDKTDGTCGCLVSCWIIRAKDSSVFSSLNLVLSIFDL